ncbi:MAG: hypothetical protein JW798_13845 [Prolixibacteraceae bacterium]|nr:hypothetical protein [Prolixibacteraceae bacterium]
MNEFEIICNRLEELVLKWENILNTLDNDVLSTRKNSQNRSIKQIVGHMADSASNNTHRTIHMQYGENPLHFPNYATHGNNDRWIAIQNYQHEDWKLLVNFWKYSNLHIAHVFRNVNPARLENQWLHDGVNGVSLRECIVDYLRHFELHLAEIEELINKGA